MVALHGGLGAVAKSTCGLVTNQDWTASLNRPNIEGSDRNMGGAMEQDQQNHGGNTSMQGQLGHRDEDVELKDADSNLAG